MKKKSVRLALACSMALTLCGCSIKIGTKIPAEWYNETLEYYREGFSSDWANEREDLHISDEMKDPDNTFGYLLRDLNGDGADELLIGIIDDSEETKFTDLYIWHSDFGAFRSLNCGDGYYMYICDDDVIKMDSWYGSQTKVDYMVYEQDGDAFLIVDGGSNPGHFDLTPFN